MIHIKFQKIKSFCLRLCKRQSFGNEFDKMQLSDTVRKNDEFMNRICHSMSSTNHSICA